MNREKDGQTERERTLLHFALCSVWSNYMFHGQSSSTLNQVMLRFKGILLNMLHRLLPCSYVGSLEQMSNMNLLHMVQIQMCTSFCLVGFFSFFRCCMCIRCESEHWPVTLSQVFG